MKRTSRSLLVLATLALLGACSIKLEVLGGTGGSPGGTGTGGTGYQGTGTCMQVVDAGLPPNPTDAGLPPNPTDAGLPPNPLDSGA